MNPADLVALSAAHGIGLDRLPQGSAGTSKPEWTVAELGQAAYGVPPIAFSAACYSWAGAMGEFERLAQALEEEAWSVRRRNGWSRTAPGEHVGQVVHYWPKLARLVLFEDAHRAHFSAAPALYAICAGVSDHIWERAICERYVALQLVYLGWLSTARRIMWPRLTDAPDDETVCS